MSVGSSVLTSLKNKMQSLRDELDKTRDLLDEKDRELEQEKAERAVVGFIKYFKFGLCFQYFCLYSNKLCCNGKS